MPNTDNEELDDDFEFDKIDFLIDDGQIMVDGVATEMTDRSEFYEIYRRRGSYHLSPPSRNN